MSSTTLLPPCRSNPAPEAVRWRRTAYRTAHLAVRDPLTGLFSRETHEEELVKAFKRATRRSAVLALIFLELRQEGPVELSAGVDWNRILQAAARRLLATSRSEDIVARYDPHAFCMTVVDTSAEAVRTIAERWRDEVESVLSEANAPPTVSLSIAAVCCLPNRSRCSFEALLKGADQAVEEARNQGEIVVRSLLTESDVSTLREIERRLFSRYLSDRGLLPAESHWRRVCPPSTTTPCIGRLARRLGWLGPRRLRRILLEQRRTHEMFGECAVRLGYLRPQEVFGLLALQRENPLDLLGVLLKEGSIDKAGAMRIRFDYLEYLAGTDRWRRGRLGRTRGRGLG